jgi:hypothetical protein
MAVARGACHGSRVIILEPISPHATLALDDACLEHDRGPDEFGWDHDAFARKTARRAPRVWRVTADGAHATWILMRDRRPVPDLRRGPAIVLALGTRLRLDAVTSGRHYDGGDHTAITRRFCVLDGPHAGTCWESEESISTEGLWHSKEPIEPIEAPETAEA